MRLCRGVYSRSGARIPVDVITPFRCNDGIRLLYENAMEKGQRIAICLEGDVGTAKGQVLWRLQSQGYQTVALPFVDWLQRERVAVDQLKESADLLVRCSEKWQDELDSLIVAATMARPPQRHGDGDKDWRPGLLFVSRSPLTSSRELKRRGLVSHRVPQTLDHVVTLGVHADSIMIARRAAEKTFNDPTSEASKLRLYLSECSKSEVGKLAESIDSTSSKQCVANLLTFVGVKMPTFPPRTKKEQQ